MLTKNEVEVLKETYKDGGMDLLTEREKTRLAYKGKEAREQLIRLLSNLKLFSKIENEKDIALRNLGISMLEDMGFLDEGNISLIVNFLFTLPILKNDK